jgi:hypothetical protein
MENLTVDHYRPRAKGGKDTSCNLVPACWSCNSSKGKKTPAEFRKYRQRFRPQKVEILFTRSEAKSTYELELDAVERKLKRSVETSDIPRQQSFVEGILENLPTDMRTTFLGIANEKAMEPVKKEVASMMNWREGNF